MKIRDFPLLTDENIDGDIVSYLRAEGFDVRDVREQGPRGASDADLIRLAFREQRVILTHDRDFGKLAVASREPIVGIIFLRPGHIEGSFSIGSLAALLRLDLEVRPPFILVLARTGAQLKIRVRLLSRARYP